MFEALYLHVPFCVRRCAYCDFVTSAVPCDDPAMDEYIDKMRRSLRLASRAGLLRGVRTVYVGGGTPTFLGVSRLAGLLDSLACALGGGRALFALSELTVEANPDSFCEEMARMLAAHGVGRVSLGVQSLDDGVLRTLGRVHDAQRALGALRLAARFFPKVSVDVICGVPGQSVVSLDATLRDAVGAGVGHVSVYPLTLADGTPLDRSVREGAIADVDEDDQADHMLAAEKALGRAGFRRYEVASYALGGQECEHNKAYWTGRSYLGLGSGAASMCDAERARALAESGALEVWDAGGGRLSLAAPPDAARLRVSLGEGVGREPEVEWLSAREALCEDAMLAMRMSAGMSAKLAARAADELVGMREVLEGAVRDGLACWDESGAFVPTQRGWLLGNRLYGAIWDCR